MASKVQVCRKTVLSNSEPMNRSNNAMHDINSVYKRGLFSKINTVIYLENHWKNSKQQYCEQFHIPSTKVNVTTKVLMHY